MNPTERPQTLDKDGKLVDLRPEPKRERTMAKGIDLDEYDAVGYSDDEDLTQEEVERDMDRVWTMADILADPEDVEKWKKWGSLTPPSYKGIEEEE